MKKLTKELSEFCEAHNVPKKYVGFLTGLFTKHNTGQNNILLEEVNKWKEFHEDASGNCESAIQTLREFEITMTQQKEIIEKLTELVRKSISTMNGYDVHKEDKDDINKALDELLQTVD